jgi:hypothetical protein
VRREDSVVAILTVPGKLASLLASSENTNCVLKWLLGESEPSKITCFTVG